MYSYGYFAFHVTENLIHFYVCVLKRFHLLLVPCELSIPHSIESSDRCLSACHSSYSWGAL